VFIQAQEGVKASGNTPSHIQQRRGNAAVQNVFDRITHIFIRHVEAQSHALAIQPFNFQTQLFVEGNIFLKHVVHPIQHVGRDGAGFTHD
jgi:hypothetical protein